jgi:predicted regulator of amino acid metabolism with ACT domain
MPDRLMTDREIVRALRLVTSQRVRHRPLTMAAIAERCGVTRRVVYLAREGIISDDVRHVLSQILAEVPVQDMIAQAAGFDRSLAGCKRYP